MAKVGISMLGPNTPNPACGSLARERIACPFLNGWEKDSTSSHVKIMQNSNLRACIEF